MDENGDSQADADEDGAHNAQERITVTAEGGAGSSELREQDKGFRNQHKTAHNGGQQDGVSLRIEEHSWLGESLTWGRTPLLYAVAGLASLLLRRLGQKE